MTDICLLTLVAPPSLEETLIDWLLMQESISGFSSTEIHGHGARSNQLNIFEQVTGRQKRIEFQIHTEISIANNMIEALKIKFPNTGLHYILTPVLSAGQI
jgi:hypothetical protein